MASGEINSLYAQFKSGEDDYYQLMRKRVRNVLLVSTFYDAFIFEQDGRLSEQIFGEYQQLNLSTAPRVVSAPTGRQALERLEREPFDLVVTMMRIGEIGPFELAEEIKQRWPNIPVLLLLNIDNDAAVAERRMPGSAIDDVFLWNGDTKLFLAMIKQVEDRMNVEDDAGRGLVRVALVVEDSIRFYSRFLPMLYEQIMQQTQRLIGQELSDINKRLRMRTRPKVLLAHTLEQAQEWMERYSGNLIGVLSDVAYPHNGEIDEQSGVKLLTRLRELPYDIPAVLQSSDQVNAEAAEKLEARFLWKHSRSIMRQLKSIMRSDWGYGDFVFREEDGAELARAADLAQFRRRLKDIPADSLLYHGAHNHFSSWLIAHGDIDLAREMRPMRIADFSNAEAVRGYLLGAFDRVWRQQTRGRVIDFDAERLTERGHITRLTEGSLGGKARSIAFACAILSVAEMDKHFPGVTICTPPTTVIGAVQYSDNSQWETLAPLLDPQLAVRLRTIAEKFDAPLAVRSSGMLEDSSVNPSSGQHITVMLANTGDADHREAQLIDAVERVLEESKHEQDNTEGMAVIIQEVSGFPLNGLFYPALSGRLRWNASENCGECLLAQGLGEIFEHDRHVAALASPDGWPQALKLERVVADDIYAVNLETGTVIAIPAPDEMTLPCGEMGRALAHLAQMMSEAMRQPVEIEFAAPLAGQLDLLQVRPLNTFTIS